jgi:hypothetical protein
MLFLFFVFMHRVAVDCIASTSDKCTASMFIQKVSIERELSEQTVGSLNPQVGEESIGWLLYEGVNTVTYQQFAISKLRPTVHRIPGQLNSRTKLCNTEVVSLVEQQTKNYVVVIKKNIWL